MAVERVGTAGRWAFVAAVVVLSMPEAAWGRGVVISAEVGQAERRFSFAGLSEDSESYQVLAGAIGIELERSLLYVGYRTEDTSFIGGRLPFERQEASIEWHWNEVTAKKNYLTVVFGVFNTNYIIGSVEEDFFGLSVGLGGRKDLVGERLFLLGTFRIKLPYTSEPRLLEEGEDGRYFLGYDARAGLGVTLDSQGLFALQFGYRLNRVDFEGVFPDDESQGPFIAARVFIPGS